MNANSSSAISNLQSQTPMTQTQRRKQMNRKPFFVVLAELITGYSPRNLGRHIRLSWFLPTPGNMIFTLLVVGCLLASQSVWLLSLRSPSGTSTKTIPYQGRLTDPHRIPLTGKFNTIWSSVWVLRDF